VVRDSAAPAVRDVRAVSDVRDAVVAREAREPAAPPDLNRVVERWDGLVVALRGAGKSVAATALAKAAPVAVNARGEVTIALDEANPIYEQALDAAKGEITALLQRWLGGVQRVTIRAAAGGAPPPARLTDEMARADRLSALRRHDPVLGAAIDALDLDLAD
jgi:hypothetical protein